MKTIEERCKKTTTHIADKILSLRRANKMTQEEFAEKVGVDRRTVARAEDGRHRPSPETIEMIAEVFKVPVSYFYDGSIYKTDVGKKSLIFQINAHLNVLSKANLQKVKDFIEIIID